MTRSHGEGRPRAGRPSSQEEAPPDPSWAPLDEALVAWSEGNEAATLTMRTDAGGEEEVPVGLFFRSVEDMGPVEATALGEARGRVLDLGAGPGAHAVPLTRRGLAVTAAEVLPAACQALRRGGVEDVRHGGPETLEPSELFDTILVLMNGLGLAGTLGGLAPFLRGLAAHLAPGGQILADSTEPREWTDPDDGRYPGEVHMQLGFQGRWGEPFAFLFVDADTLAEAAASAGLASEVAAREEDGRYLARLTTAPPSPAP